MTKELLVYGFLPLVAFCTTFMLFLRIRKAKPFNLDAYLLFASMTILAASQSVAYVIATLWGAWSIVMWLADTFLMSIGFFMSSLLIFAIGLGGTKHPARYALYVLPLFLVVLHNYGMLIESYRITPTSIMHNDGPLSWVFDLFVLSTLLSVIFVCFFNLKRIDDPVLLSKNRLLMVSFVPTLVGCGVLLALSATRYAVSAAVFAPVIIIYTSLTYSYLSRDNVANATAGLRFLWSRVRLANKILELERTQANMKEVSNLWREQIIREAYYVHNGNVIAMSKETGFETSTIYRLLKEYDLKPRQAKEANSKQPASLL